MRGRADGDVAPIDALAQEFGPHLRLERRADRGESGETVIVEPREHGPRARRAESGKPHAEGRQHAGERMNEHGCDAERVSHEAGMLAARAAERVQHILGHVVAALDGDGLDRVRHVFDRDPDEAVGDLFRRALLSELAGKRLERFAHGIGVERQVLIGTENAREEVGDELSRHHIGVGDGERALAPVAEGAWIGARRVGPDAEAGFVVMKDRAASGRDGMDQHHRRPHADAGHLALEAPLVSAVIVGDVGRGAAHVEADHLGEACCPRGLDRSHDAPRRPRQDRVLASEQSRRSQSARGLHEQQSRTSRLPLRAGGFHGGCDAIDVTPEQRREIGIDHGGIAAPDEFHERAHLVAGGDVSEPFIARELRRLALMRREGVRMHKDDGNGGDAFGPRRAERRPRRRAIERGLDAAIGAHALGHLDDARIEHRGFFDPPREDFGPRLVADLERVTEALAHDQEEGIAFPLEQRVGGDRRPHPDACDRLRRQLAVARDTDQIGDAGKGCVPIGFRILRQQLACQQAAVGRPRHEVGERAAAVDEELPRAAAAHAMRLSPFA